MLQGSMVIDVKLPELTDKTIKSFIRTLSEHDRKETEALSSYLLALKELTSKIDEIKADERQNRKKNRARFNVFNCLTRHHLEELHSNFLCYLLNPKESHDCNDMFLSEFYSGLHQGNASGSSPELLENHRFDCAWVEREHYCGVIEGSRTFIDIYIETPTLIIAIENKINAGEQTDQIMRYAKYCKRSKKKYLVLYLTKTGEKSNTAKSELYQAISYENDINKWLDSCMELVAAYPMAYTGLRYYSDLLNEKILNQPPNTVIMKLKDLLLNDENVHLLKYAKELTNATTEVSNQLRKDFFIALGKELSTMNIDFQPAGRILTPISANNIWDKVHQGYTCHNGSLSLMLNGNIKLYFCIEHDQIDVWYGLFAVNVNNSQGTNGKNVEETRRIKEIMISKLPTITPEDGWWVCTRYFQFDGFAFGDDDMSYLLATRMKDAVGQFMTELQEYLKAWKETVIQFNNENNSVTK